MATYNSDIYEAGIARTGLNDSTRVGKFALTAALALNDVLNVCRIPAGATVHDIYVHTTDLDTGGSPAITLDLGDSGSATRYLSASTIAQAGGSARLTGAPYSYTSEDTLKLTVSAGPATGATSGTIWVVVQYTVDR